jgi:hypothetical protein
VLVAAVVVAGGLTVWLLPTWITLHPRLGNAPDRYKAVADARTGMVAFLAVLGGLGGLYYTSRAFRLSQQTHRLSAEGQVTDRYSKAVDQLGSPSPEVCLGGIYALGRIMRDSPRDERAVVAVLSAFVRRQAKKNDDLTVPWPEDEAERDDVKPSFKVQAALNVLGEREAGDTATAADLRDSDLRGARLRHARLYGASLRRSYLYMAHLTGADLGEASLVDADLTGAFLDGASLVSADLRRAQLTGADLTGADLTGALFSAGALSPGQQQTARNGGKIILGDAASKPGAFGAETAGTRAQAPDRS